MAEPTNDPNTATSAEASEDALAAFANGLSGLIAKHKKETISIKAARSWQFRAKKSVNESWAKVLKKKGTEDALEKVEEEDRGRTEAEKKKAAHRRRQKRASRKAEEKAHADGIRATIAAEVEKYDYDLTTNFDELFEKEVVYAVDELRTRGDNDTEGHHDDDGEGEGGGGSGGGGGGGKEINQDKLGKLQKIRDKKRNQSRRGSLLARAGSSFDLNAMADEVDKSNEISKLIHGVFWHIHSALERRRARPLETFRTFDKDESGTITHDEFLAGCGKMGYTISNTESALIFDTLDADGSGELDYRELVQHIKRAGRRGPPEHKDEHRIKRSSHVEETDDGTTKNSNEKKKKMPAQRRLHPGRNKPTLYQRMLRADTVALQGGSNGKKEVQSLDPTVEVLGYGLRIPPASDSKVYCRRADVLVGRGLALCEIGAFAEAQVQFEQGLDADPSHVQSHMQLASLLFKTNKLDPALTHFRQCVKLCPNWPDPMFNCGVVEHRLSRLHHAKKSFQRTLDLQQQVQRKRKHQRVLPGDDVDTQAAHNLILIERRLGRFRADSATDLRSMKQRRNARKLREALEMWFERGRGMQSVEEARARLERGGHWPLPPMFEYSTTTSRKFIRGEDPDWEKLREVDSESQENGESEESGERRGRGRGRGSNNNDNGVFGSDDESSEDETEETRELRLHLKYVEHVVQSLVSGAEDWSDFPMSTFKQESRGVDMVSNPHLSWALTKARLLNGNNVLDSVAAVSTSHDSRVVPVNDHEKMEREALRKAIVVDVKDRTLHQIELLVKASRGFPYLSRFNSSDLRAIWKNIKFTSKKRGDVLIKEGDVPQLLMIILDGRCWLRKKIDHACGKSRNMTVGKADEGEAVGEDELRRRLPMRTEAVAAQDMELLTLTRAEYESTVQIVNQRDSGDKEEQLKVSRALEGFNDQGQELKRLALLAQRRHYPNGAVIASIGSSAAELLLVVQGLVHAVRPVHYASTSKDMKNKKTGDEYDVIVATLIQGKVMGASVVLDPFNPRYKLTYKCATAVEVIVLGKEAFELRKVTSGVMMSLERASIRSLSIEACTRVIDDKRKDAFNRTMVLRKLKFIPPRRHPDLVEKEWLRKKEAMADEILSGRTGSTDSLVGRYR